MSIIFKDTNGDEFQEILLVSEEEAMQYAPTHALVVVKVGNDYLMGWNRWRKDWEIFGGCKEEGETLRQCIVREGQEELGLTEDNYEYLGLMKFYLSPSYFSPEWRTEYGGLYGITISAERLAELEKARADKEEVERLCLYREIPEGEKIAGIDEKLLEYWK